MSGASLCGISQRCFSLETTEATIQFQIIDLGKQYYVWMSAAGPRLGGMHLAIKTPVDHSKPAVATVIQGNAGGANQSLAQRLALKVSKPVLCSSCIPSNAPMLQAIAERRLLQEITSMVQEANLKPLV